ncbi:hypothetical protein [Arenicella xantha]|uniref:Uncharacterized protein n=1 Tax=Arenicella xantha TaxID=644221 RepID=A0A395JPY7_9GAMM|nr:hypothetical protein [Arenicella xantha]RBP53577.1 hypothetical protein DFR28_101964 [Arenicella xantha]
MHLFKRSYSVLFLALSLLWAGSAAAEKTILPETEGLWEYTGLITSSGESLPLTGVFLIKDGIFLQQGIFNGESFDDLGSMAHAGTCWAGGAGLVLKANQTLSMSPVDDEKLSSAGVTDHDLKATRKGDDLTLVFGAGTSTIQTFKRIGDGNDMRVYQLADGTLALSDGYFVLVTGSAQGAVTGYGKFDQAGDVLTLNVIRWSQSDGITTRNLKDVSLKAFFDGKSLNLPDGKTFSVIN